MLGAVSLEDVICGKSDFCISCTAVALELVLIIKHLYKFAGVEATPLENVNVDDNGDLIIDFQKVTIGENEIEKAKISFTGTSAAATSYEITIEPLVVKIENVKKSSVKIEGIKIRP